MAAPTVNVTTHVDGPDGNPLVGANVFFKLNNAEVDAGLGYIVANSVSGVTDASGDVVLAVWPNELGATASMYKVTISHSSSRAVTSVLATIPNSACNLWDVANLPAYPGKSDGQLAVDAAAVSAAAALVSEGLADADAIATAADVVLTNADVVLTNADVVLTNADVVTVAGIYDDFDDRYLGPLASAPTLDNDGNALITGALYWNSTDDSMYIRTSGAAWTQAFNASVGIVDNADATAITIDASENVGIGVTPEAWDASYSALQLGGYAFLMTHTAETASRSFNIGQNAYQDGSWKYKITDEASRYLQSSGTHTFYVAPSGTADTAITWTTALTIDNAGDANFGGEAYFVDNKPIYVGTGLDSRWFHDGTNTYLDNTTGSLIINNGGGDTDFGGTVNLGNNKKANFGASSELNVRHNGVDAYINNTAGDMNFEEYVNSGAIVFTTYNSVGATKTGIAIGGATPKTSLYYDGVVACSTNTGGIAFGSDTADANTLDDYEEGTWTPSITSATGTITTVGTVGGTYVKIGRSVTLSWTHAITTNGTGATRINIAGLPFASSSTGYGTSAARSTGDGLTSVFLLTASTSEINQYRYDNAYPAIDGATWVTSLTYQTT